MAWTTYGCTHCGAETNGFNSSRDELFDVVVAYKDATGPSGAVKVPYETTTCKKCGAINTCETYTNWM